MLHNASYPHEKTYWECVCKALPMQNQSIMKTVTMLKLSSGKLIISNG